MLSHALGRIGVEVQNDVGLQKDRVTWVYRNAKQCGFVQLGLYLYKGQRHQLRLFGNEASFSTLMLSLMFSHVLLRTLVVLLLETDSSIPPDVLGAHSGGMTASQAILTSQLYSQDDQTEVCPPFARG